MKQLIAGFTAFIILSAFLSCKKEENTQEEEYPEYIVFGRFIAPGCEGIETCMENYKMVSGKIMEDALDQVPQVNQPYPGDYSVPCLREDYETIEALLRNQIPESLLDRQNGMVGTSPAWNTTYFYFEYKTSKRHKYFIIDGSFDGNLGPELQNFASLLNQAISFVQF